MLAVHSCWLTAAPLSTSNRHQIQVNNIETCVLVTSGMISCARSNGGRRAFLLPHGSNPQVRGMPH